MKDCGQVVVLGKAATARILTAMVVDRLDAIEALTRQHPDGVLLRLPRRNMIVISDDAQIRQVLVERGSRYQKGLGQAEARTYLGQGLLTAEGEQWRVQRKSVAPLLRARTIQELVPTVQAEAVRCADELLASGKRGKAVQVPEVLARYTLACLGHALGFQPPPAAEVMHAFEVLQRAAMVDAMSQGVVRGTWVPGLRREVREAQETLEEAAREAIASGIWSVSPPWAQVEGMISLFLAGYETTASVLSWTCHVLARRPALQAELAREASAVFPAQASAAGSGELSLAREVFREVIRLRPPVWLVSRRALEDDDVGGVKVRRGDDVLMCVHAYGRLGPHGSLLRPGLVRTGVASTMQFGLGPRSCPGGSLAEVEGTLWISEVCRRLELGLIPGSWPRPAARMSQSIAGGYAVRVKARGA